MDMNVPRNYWFRHPLALTRPLLHPPNIFFSEQLSALFDTGTTGDVAAMESEPAAEFQSRAAE